MSDMSLKYKQIFSTLGLVLFVLALSTTIVLLTVRNQNQKASYQSVTNAFKIINISMADLSKKLKSNGKQAVSAVKTRESIEFIQKYRKDSDTSLIR